MVDAVAPQGKLLRAWQLEGGISAQMTALEVEQQDGRRRKLVVRRPHPEALARNPQAAADEFRLLQVLSTAGVAAPRPYALGPAGEATGGPYLVLEYVEGVLVFAPSDLDGCLLQMAEHLARIHCVSGPAVDLSFLPRQGGACVESLGRRRPDLSAALDVGPIHQALATSDPGPQRNRPVLLHGDYWPGNLLWREGRLVAVVDWEDAQVGDPLVDLGKTRLEIAWIFGLPAMEAFTRRYRSLSQVDESHLAYWDLCAALRLARLVGSDLAGWVAFFAPFGRPDITPQTVRDDYDAFVWQALAGWGM